MSRITRTTVVLIAAAAAVLLVLGGVALGSRPATVADFAPFKMRVTWWTAAAIQRQDLPAEAGTAVQLLDYRSIDSWRLTLASSSWDPASVGTTIEVANGTHSTLLGQTGQLVRRTVPAQEGKMAPLRWVIPGLADELQDQGFTRLASASVGTTTFVERGANVLARPDGAITVDTGTIVVFDSATRLPLSVATYRDGALRQSFQFEVVGR